MTQTKQIRGDTDLKLTGDVNASLLKGAPLGGVSYNLTVTDAAQADGTFGVATVSPPSGGAVPVDFGAIPIGSALTIGVPDGTIECVLVAYSPATREAKLSLRGPLTPHDYPISWQTNEGAAAKPPTDRADWVRIIRATTPHDGVRVVLTTVDRGHWRVSVADETPVTVGSGPVDLVPINHRAAVTEALRDAGKPVRD